MDLLRFSLIFCLILVDYGLHVIAENKVFTYEFLMPDVRPHENNIYLCTSIKIRDNFHLVAFEPTGSMGAHQMVLYGCSEPGTNFSLWSCIQTSEVCRSGSVDLIVYAWSQDAPGFNLPKGVGFSVGGESPIQYLVMQAQYLTRLKKGQYDNSGVFINYTKQQMPLQAGMIILETNYGTIHYSKRLSIENACTLLEEKAIHPFAFRAHTDDFCEMVAGYVVRQGVIGDKWTMLGKKNPQLHQMFSPVADNTPINPGDVLATRCIIKNPRNYSFRIGLNYNQEKCQFYLMYWVENSAPLNRKYCFSLGPPVYYWSRAIENFQHIPKSSEDSELD